MVQRRAEAGKRAAKTRARQEAQATLTAADIEAGRPEFAGGPRAWVERRAEQAAAELEFGPRTLIERLGAADELVARCEADLEDPRQRPPASPVGHA